MAKISPPILSRGLDYQYNFTVKEVSNTTITLFKGVFLYEEDTVFKNFDIVTRDLTSH